MFHDHQLSGGGNIEGSRSTVGELFDTLVAPEALFAFIFGEFSCLA
jgi:hypothetical protein